MGPDVWFNQVREAVGAWGPHLLVTFGEGARGLRVFGIVHGHRASTTPLMHRTAWSCNNRATTEGVLHTYMQVTGSTTQYPAYRPGSPSPTADLRFQVLAGEGSCCRPRAA